MAITIANQRITPYEQKSDLSKIIFGDEWGISIILPTTHIAGDEYVLAIDFERIVYPADHPVCAYTTDFEITTEGQKQILTMSVLLESSRLAKWLSELKKPTPMCLQIARLRNGIYETLLLDDILALPSIVNPEMYEDDESPIGELLESKIDAPESAGSAGQVLTLGESGETIWADAGQADIGDGSITIKQGGTTKGVFSVNQAENQTVNIDAPNNAVITLKQGDATKGTFSTNQSNNATISFDAPQNGKITLTQGGVSKGSFTVNQSNNAMIDFDSGIVPNNATVTIIQGGVTKGSFTLNQSNNETINIDSGVVPNNAKITIVQGGVSKGSFTVNQDTDQTINIDAGGSGGGSVTWGAISGTLANQTDLQTALNGKQATIDSAHKLDYSLISNTPAIPTVGSGVLTITQNGTSKGTFNANATGNATISLVGENNVIESVKFNGTTATISGKTAVISATIPTVNNPAITITQGGVSKGSFTLNQTNAQTIALDAGGGGGSWDGTFPQVVTSASTLEVSPAHSYYWEVGAQDVTLTAESPSGVDYEVPIDLIISGGTVTVSGITRNGLFADNCKNRCVVTKRYDKTLIYVYCYEAIS